MRYGAIDIGSNAVRLLIADIIQKGKDTGFKKNTLIRVPLRLGDDAFLDKKISPAKARDLIKTMTAFRQLMDVYKVEDYMACATSAMREARNGADIVSMVKSEAGIELEIVEGQKEANIIYSTHIAENLDLNKNYLYIDVGGGSTELSVFSGGRIAFARSFPIGTVRMLDNADAPETWEEMKQWIKENTRKYKNLSGIGTGGNINKLFRISEEKDGKPLSINKLNDIYLHLRSHSLKERISVLGLNQDRADVIIPACEIYLTVMKWASVRHMYVPRVGLVDGIIQTLIDKNIKS
ncbi:exopolyphosphatase/guanosine-5'-triphosphate,3'-diphosphate pyrophosphatase [Arcticibacter tournemirensis]|uniref:Exopolyphosphatase n=1 Tax=Arcticibacter tournemirensis TaxID=699437 RepID=A0A4Q0M9E8_9SPHI|nr:exopolyphosphatase [Arcticibacter tournemirensis]KAA8484383.1 exopolyphosphatase [Arcticibacter tournemirensis]RXF69807.1 exopolyphosphatase [Arcticibacter tournemirensis]TQM49825.1 exopolyphosphatase/guanosine-5'-triphosphate,3'-diphosphate pyrophosphatase [Arcticibacter tournemirensis]